MTCFNPLVAVVSEKVSRELETLSSLVDKEVHPSTVSAETIWEPGLLPQSVSNDVSNDPLGWQQRRPSGELAIKEATLSSTLMMLLEIMWGTPMRHSYPSWL